MLFVKIQEALCQNDRKWIEKILLPIFFLSTVFMVMFSGDAVNHWAWPWNQLTISFACLFPVFLVFLIKVPEWLRKREFSFVLIVVPIIFYLGLLNAIFGEESLKNFKGMGLFLLSGITVFVAAKLILDSRKAQSILLWILTVVLVYVSFRSIYAQLRWGLYTPVISNNPIPESAIITLLLAGPLMLLGGQEKVGRRSLIFCLALGVVAILVLRQRAAILSMVFIVLLFGFIFGRRFWLCFLGAILIMAMALKDAYVFSDKLPESAQDYLVELKVIPVERMEMYFFAYHLIKKRPLMGTGLWAPLSSHLVDYKERVTLVPDSKKRFRDVVNRRNTSFHNIFLCMLVQMGSLFAVTYLCFIGYLFVCLKRLGKNFPDRRLNFQLFSILLAGFIVQSLFFDSLMYPDINFLFHLLLGLMVNFKGSHSRSKHIEIKAC